MPATQNHNFFSKILKIQGAPPLFVQKIKNLKFLFLRKTCELSFYPIFKMFILKSSEKILVSKLKKKILWAINCS